MSSLEEIRTSIEARIADAQREISSLETARRALRGDRATVPRATRSRAGGTGENTRGPKSRKAARQTKRQKRVGEPDASAVPASTGASAPRADAPRKPRPRPGRRAQKSVEVLAAGKLEAMLREAQQGLSAVAIAKAANARASQVRELLDDRQAAGEVRRVGTGRGTRWRLITDEERVAERAAELEQLATGTA